MLSDIFLAMFEKSRGLNHSTPVKLLPPLPHSKSDRGNRHPLSAQGGPSRLSSSALYRSYAKQRSNDESSEPDRPPTLRSQVSVPDSTNRRLISHCESANIYSISFLPPSRNPSICRRYGAGGAGGGLAPPSPSLFGGFDASWPGALCGAISPRSSGSSQPSDAFGCSSTFFAPSSSGAADAANSDARVPQRAVLTVDEHSAKVLIANDLACKLLGLEQSKLVGRSLRADVHGADATQALIPALFDEHGRFVKHRGRVVALPHARQANVSLAIWSTPLLRAATVKAESRPSLDSPERSGNGCRLAESDGARAAVAGGRWLVLLEPVEKLDASCVVGPAGRIFSADEKCMAMLGFESSADMLGLDVAQIVPSFAFRQQTTDCCCCAASRMGGVLPIALKTIIYGSGETVEKYELRFRMFATISGCLILSECGEIRKVNEQFVSALFGYERADLVEQPVTVLLPDFYKDMVTAEEEEEDDLDKFFDCSEHPNRVFEMEAVNNHDASPPISPISSRFSHLSFVSNGADSPLSVAVERASSKNTAPPLPPRIIEGSYRTFARHADSSAQFMVVFHVRRVRLPDGSVGFRCWVVRDQRHLVATALVAAARASPSSDERADDDDDALEMRRLWRKSSSDESSSLAMAVTSRRPSTGFEPATSELVCGAYAEHYDTLQQIGRGAFGAVKLAASKTDGLLVVTKFILKRRILAESWTKEEDGSAVPTEIHFLRSLDHPNIVKMLDVFDNDTYYQLVMEKHGCGMDLFDFIDRAPNLDEKLQSYLFRQVVAAVSYLHSRGIVHRDVKDENVILDESFCCKLIDFGSAAFFDKSTLFSTFCGTLEYCSPEVLLGNKYNGPEVEVWSLGIFLYTLIFGENPFRTPEETIEANFCIQYEVSEGVSALLGWLLQPQACLRATVSEAADHWWTKQPVDVSQYCFSDVLPSLSRAECSPPRYLAQISA